MESVSNSTLGTELNKMIRVFRVLASSIDYNVQSKQPTDRFVNSIETTLKTLQSFKPDNFVKNFIVTPTTDQVDTNLVSTQLPAELNTEKATAEQIYSQQITERKLDDQTPESRRNLLEEQIADHNSLIEDTNEALETAIKEYRFTERPSVYKAQTRPKRRRLPMYEFMDGLDE